MDKPIRTTITFDLDGDGLLYVEPGWFQDEPRVLLHITPGGVRRGQAYTCFLHPDRALALSRALINGVARARRGRNGA